MTEPSSAVAAPATGIVEAAVAYARRGWRVIPLHGVRGPGVCTCERGANCASAGKHPITTGWQNTPPLSVPDILETWARHPLANVGVATGAPSGFFVLDIDPDAGGFDSMRQIVTQHGSLPTTAVQQTGSGGWHYLFAMPPGMDVRNKQHSARWLGGLPGIDVRGTGGQIVIAPSVSGKGPYAFSDLPIAPAPEWLLRALEESSSAPTLAAAPIVAQEPPDPADAARLASYAQRAVEYELARLAECSQKATSTGPYLGPPWNHTTYAVACNLTELANSPWSGLTHEQVEFLLAEHAPRDAGFGDYEISKCLSSARGTVGGKGRQAPAPKVDLFAPFGQALPTVPSAPGEAPIKRTWDDLGNAMRVVDHFSDRLRYVTASKFWAVYDGRRWVMDATDAAISMIQGLIANLVELEGHQYDDQYRPEQLNQNTGEPKVDEKTERDAFYAWAAKQRMAARIDACEKMARVRPELKASPADFDADVFLFNCLNGTIDLRTGTLLPHDPKRLQSQIAGVAFDPQAQAPRWEAFLARCMPNVLMRAYLQRAAGWSISGDTSSQAMCIHQGVGANGKSQFLIVMQKVLGDYNQIVPRTTLLMKSGDSIPTDIARMLGKRFMQVSETAAGRRLDEETVKSLTGGEAAVARHLYGREFEFTPTGKIHYVTNHLPRVSDSDATWRRLHLFSWRVVIPEGERLANLGQMLAAEEGPGILNWLVAGFLNWQQIGLAPPEEAIADLTAYRSDQDELGEFLDSHLVPTAGAEASIGSIYRAYQRWVAESGIGTKAMSRQTLALAMRERGYVAYRKADERGFLGVTVKAYAPADLSWS